MTGIINKLLYISPRRKLLYVTDVASGRPIHDLQHLSCFLPGLFALGVHALDLSPRDKELHTWVAQGLAHTCWITYADQATGLGPDGVQFDEQSRLWVDVLAEWERGGRAGGAPPGVSEVPEEHAADKRDYRVSSSVYLLRPEVCRSFVRIACGIPMMNMNFARFRRPWNRCSSCGRPPGMYAGEKGGGLFTKPSRSIRASSMDTRLFAMLTKCQQKQATICRGTLNVRFTSLARIHVLVVAFSSQKRMFRAFLTKKC